MVKQRMLESTAMMMIGDGLLALVQPRRHMQVWESGPRLWRMMMRPFLASPALTRSIGALELAAGIWLARCQQPPQQRRIV